MRPASARPTASVLGTANIPLQLSDAVRRLSSANPRDESWEPTVSALSALTQAATSLGSALPPDIQRALVQPFIILLSAERSALAGAAADALAMLAATAGGALPLLATEALWARLLENAGAGNRVNARANAGVALALAARGTGAPAAWAALVRTLLPASGNGGGSRDVSGGGGSEVTKSVGTREAAYRLFNIMLGKWSDEALARATGLGLGGGDGNNNGSGGGVGSAAARASAVVRGADAAIADPSGTAVALLRLGLCDGSQALRRLGRANFRLVTLRLPAVAEAVRVRHGRAAARQLASVITEELADAAALRAIESDGFAFASESSPVCLNPPEGAARVLLIVTNNLENSDAASAPMPTPSPVVRSTTKNRDLSNADMVIPQQIAQLQSRGAPPPPHPTTTTTTTTTAPRTTPSSP